MLSSAWWKLVRGRSVIQRTKNFAFGLDVAWIFWICQKKSNLYQYFKKYFVQNVYKKKRKTVIIENNSNY